MMSCFFIAVCDFKFCAHAIDTLHDDGGVLIAERFGVQEAAEAAEGSVGAGLGG